MKIVFIAFALLCSTFVLAQKTNGSSLPNVNIKSLDGRLVNASALSNAGRPFIVVVWATWCQTCKNGLNEIHYDHLPWLQQNGVKLIAVSMDDSRNKHKVAPYVQARGWTFENYIDENQSFRHAMGVQDPPYTMVFDGNARLVWQQSGLFEDDSDLLLEEVYKLIK